MNFIFLFIFIFKIYFIKTDHQIANESTIYAYVPPKNPDISWLTYQFFLKIHICKYVKNDSYVMEGNSSSKIIDIFRKSYYKSTQVKIVGSDLKFIQYSVVSYPGVMDSDDQDHIEIEKSISKSIINAYTEFKVTITKMSSLSNLYLYVVKNDNTDFVNICELFDGNNDNIVYRDNVEVNWAKSKLMKFSLKSNFKSEIFKVIVLEYTINSIYYKNKPIFIETIPYHLENLYILLGCIIGASIIGLIIFIIYKRKNKNKIDSSHNNKENDYTVNDTPYTPYDKPNSDTLTPAPIASY